MPHAGDVLVDLVAGQLAALAGLGALGHLDLDVVGVDQVLGGDAKAPRGHLLDGRAHGIAVGQANEAVRFLAALAGVRAAADAVHGDGQGGVGLAADRAEAHRPGGEALDDGRGRLDLVQGDGCFGWLEPHQAAQGQQARALFVDGLGEGLVVGRDIAAHGVLQLGHRVRRPGVLFPAQAPGVGPAHVQHVAIDRRIAERVAVAAHALLGHLDQADTLDGGGGAGEVALHEVGGEAHGVEDLGPAVGLVG